jgi:hypothetical protein
VRTRVFGFLVLCGSILTVVGCNPAPPTNAPVRAAASYDSEAIVNASFKQYDSNSNGTLESGELASCGSLKHFAGKKGSLTKEVLRKHVASYVEKGPENAVVNVGAVVELGGSPLEGATVTLTPEAFMGSGFEPVSGTTDSRGYVEFRSPAGAGIAAGFYKISISKKDPGGKETVPEKYNTASKEGREISNGPRGADIIEIKLSR